MVIAIATIHTFLVQVSYWYVIIPNLPNPEPVYVYAVCLYNQT